MQRAAEVPGQVADQPLPGVAERAFRRAVGQRPDGRAVGDQRNRGSAVSGDDITGDGGAVQGADTDLGQAQAGGEFGDGGVQQPVDIGGGFQPLAQVSQDLGQGFCQRP